MEFSPCPSLCNWIIVIERRRCLVKQPLWGVVVCHEALIEFLRKTKPGSSGLFL